jgi:hypothetical protein
MATTADTPDPTAAPQPAVDDDAPTPPTPINPPPNAAHLRAVFDAMQDAEKAVSDAVQNMARPRAS